MTTWSMKHASAASPALLVMSHFRTRLGCFASRAGTVNWSFTRAGERGNPILAFALSRLLSCIPLVRLVERVIDRARQRRRRTGGAEAPPIAVLQTGPRHSLPERGPR